MIPSRICGTPVPSVWPNVINLPHYNVFKPKRIYPRRLRVEYNSLPESALDLLDRMLALDPSQRISASQTLDHAFIKDVESTVIQNFS
ncbi:hypothetical protein MXB_5547 [Myxobolus squamalis]|nr:hypothetical protein MXB_5547 [Myxobolus squamalis]